MGDKSEKSFEEFDAFAVWTDPNCPFRRRFPSGDKDSKTSDSKGKSSDKKQSSSADKSEKSFEEFDAFAVWTDPNCPFRRRLPSGDKDSKTSDSKGKFSDKKQSSSADKSEKSFEEFDAFAVWTDPNCPFRRRLPS